jgi:hypothetical protein
VFARLLTPLATIFVAGSLHAQVTAMVPGDLRLRTANIQAGTDSFRIESKFGGQTRKTTLTRTIRRVRTDGRDQFVLAQLYRTETGNTVDTSWVDAQTLAPVRYFADVYGEIQTMRINGRTATGTVTPRDSATRQVTVNGIMPFFNAVALDLVYTSLPWTAGFTVTVPIYNPPRASFMVMLSVTGEESLPLAAGGTITAWKLDYRIGPNVQHVWVDKRTGEFLRIGGMQGASYYYKYRADLERPMVP